MAADKSNRNAVRFSRFIRLSWATALGASVSVGVSLFILLGTFLSLSAGRPLTLPYLLLALIALPILLTIAERSGVTSGSTSPYRMARASESIWLTYATGWILIAGYIILSALLALGTASELNIILQAFVEEPLDLSLIAVGVVALIAINNLVGTRFNLRTVTGLVAFGLAIVVVISLQRVWNGQIQSSALSFGRIQKPLNIVTLMTSIFWGFYLVMRTRDQIHRPVKNIFLALLYTASLGIFFGYLGSITLRDYSVRLGVSMQLLERVDPLTLTQQISPATFQLLYAIGGLIILLIGLHFSIINALDLIDGMAQDGFLPSFMQSESKLFKTPLVPILLFSIFSILAIMFIRVELVVGLAALTFLWSVALSHLPFAIRSSPNLPDNRNPRLPFHPLFPGLVVAIGFFMPIYLARQTWWYGLIWIACGILFYLVYARRRGALVRRRDLTIGMVEKPEDEAERENRIMVGIANPRTAGDLIRAGIKIASAKNGTLFVLKILQLADQVPDYLKHNMAQDEWQDLKNFIEGLEIDTSGVHVHPIVRLSHNPATGILETVREEKIDLLLIGWSRDAVNNDINAPSIINTLIRFAKCEVAVLHGAFPQQINRLVIPTDGGPNSEVAVSLSQALSEPGKNVTEVVHVRRSDDQSGLTQADIADILAGAQGFSDGDHPIQTRTFTADSIYQGIISAAEGSDLIVIGATQEDVLGRSYIGDIPARVSTRRPTIHCYRAWEPSITLSMVGTLLGLGNIPAANFVD